MGYYSDVGLALNKEAAIKFKNILDNLDEQSQETKEIKSFILNDAKRRNNAETGEELYIWYSTKWYTDDPAYFPEITLTENFIKNLEDDEFLFIRIGENFDDIEIQGDYWANSFDFGFERRLVSNLQ